MKTLCSCAFAEKGACCVHCDMMMLRAVQWGVVNFFLNVANMDVAQTFCGRAKGAAEWMLF